MHTFIKQYRRILKALCLILDELLNLTSESGIPHFEMEKKKLTLKSLLGRVVELERRRTVLLMS